MERPDGVIQFMAESPYAGQTMRTAAAWIKHLEEALEREEGAINKLGAEFTRLEKEIATAPRLMEGHELPEEGWTWWNSDSCTWETRQYANLFAPLIARPPQQPNEPDVARELYELLCETVTDNSPTYTRDLILERFTVELREGK